jgi:hypothetical protein
MSCIPRPADLEYRRFVTNRVVTATGCLAILVVPFFWKAFVDQGPVLCLSRGLLGIPCPGCGLTRAFCALAELDLGAAIRFNALSLPLLALFVVAPVVAMQELSQGRRFGWYRFLYSSRFARWFAAALVLYHLGRLSVWLADGTLVNEYLKSAWAWRLFAG